MGIGGIRGHWGLVGVLGVSGGIRGVMGVWEAGKECRYTGARRGIGHKGAFGGS